MPLNIASLDDSFQLVRRTEDAFKAAYIAAYGEAAWVKPRQWGDSTDFDNPIVNDARTLFLKATLAWQAKVEIFTAEANSTKQHTEGLDLDALSLNAPLSDSISTPTSTQER